LLLAPGLHLSFQRYPRAAGQAVPSSLGALPVGVDAQGAVLVPVADDEAFWIGIEPAPGTRATGLRFVVEASGGAVTLPPQQVAGPCRIVTWPGADHAPRPFSRADCDRIRVAAGSVEFAIRLVCYRAFSDATGQPPPSRLDPAAGYGGWRLP
jgi:hypothetical protein